MVSRNKAKEMLLILSAVEKISAVNLNRKVLQKCHGTEADVIKIRKRFVADGTVKEEGDPTHSQRKFYSLIPGHSKSARILEALSKDEAVKSDYIETLRPYQGKKLTKRERLKVFEYGTICLTALTEAITYLGFLSSENFYGFLVAEKSLKRIESKIKLKEQLISELIKVDKKLALSIKASVEDGILNREFTNYK